MKLYIMIGAVVIVLAVIGTMVVRSVSARRERQARYDHDVRMIEAWIADIMAAPSPDAVAEIGAFDRAFLKSSWHDQPDGDSIKGFEEARDRLDQAWTVQQYRQGDDAKRLDMLFNLLQGYSVFPTQFDLGFAKSEIPQIINDRVAEERRLLSADQPGSVVRYHTFRQSQYWNRVSKLGVDTPDVPDDWNTLVARAYRTPSIEVFTGYRREPEQGDVRLWAAEALSERSLMLGKVVLAYCDISRGEGRRPAYPYRDAIGAVLLADVTKMVHAIHDEQHLFV